MNHKKIVAFDLDGTLLDTAPDFLIAVNTLQERHNTNKSSFKDISIIRKINYIWVRF
jgi:phosphoglycolate phosphatase-like HAD superfamily hydrolase